MFGEDMLYDIPFIADWKKIGENRQQLTDLNNTCKTEDRINYNYQVAQKVLVQWWYPPQSRVQVSKRAMDNHISPYKWSNQGSMQKQIWKNNYLERKTVWRIIDNELQHSKKIKYMS